MSFTVHQELVSRYTAELLRHPLPGYAGVSWEQVKRADAELFMRLAELTQGNLGRSSDGRRPLDQHVMATFSAAPVSQLLMALPMVPKPPLAPQSKAVKREAPSSGSSGKDRGLPLPAALQNVGAVARTPEGKRICYGFNLNTCTADPCPRGLHVCAKCLRPGHTALQCTTADA
eukprot:2861457-Amphidinium_carterae.2